MTITFIGHGYVGLVTACVFADLGNNVFVIGRNHDKIAKLNAGEPLIYEPGLKELLEKNLKAKRLHFTLDYGEAVPKSDVVFIAVGTPPKENGEADLTTVLSVAEEIGRHLKSGYTVVSCKSTVPVGTNTRVKEIIDRVKPQQSKVEVASCPEFLREGTALLDTLNPDRVVIGSDSRKAIDVLLELHKPLNGERIITDLSSAELIKYTSNAMLATKISFANLISFYCEATGADVETVLDAVGLDKRIGRVFMSPGVGYGGSCLPKDIKALKKIGDRLGVDTAFLAAIDNTNIKARENFIGKIIKHSPGKKIAVWGLSFKPNTDDIREAPSTYIITALLKKGFTVSVYDPEALENSRRVFGNKLKYFDNPYETLQGNDALVVITEWNEFKQADLSKVKKLLLHPVIFDARNIYEPANLKELGFHYYSIGRKPV